MPKEPRRSGESRDAYLARTKYADKPSANSHRPAPARANASDAEIYDQVRATDASADRRSRSKSTESVSRWRRSVKPEWNR